MHNITTKFYTNFYHWLNYFSAFSYFYLNNSLIHKSYLNELKFEELWHGVVLADPEYNGNNVFWHVAKAPEV